MEKIKIFDNLNLSKDKEVLKIINNEKIYYSEIIVKINNIGKNQERLFILTNMHVYYFKKNKMKRKIPLISILGISYSSISDEFIIHGKNEQYDTQYISEYKILIICLILVLYQELEDIIMPICEINEKSLKEYVTTEKEKKKNRKMSKMDLSFQIDTKLFLEKNKQLYEKEDTDKKKPKNKQALRMMSYSEYQDFIIMESKIKIEHFKLFKEIKRDIFGPIILAKYLKDNKLYILKYIDKYILAKKNIIEKKIFEKKILQQLEYPFINKMSFCFQKEDKIFFGFNNYKTIDLYNQLCLFRCFSEDKVKFFASIIGLTLEFLHNNKIIYRDFNLKNILINEDGYLLFDNFLNSKSIEESDTNYINYSGEIKYMAPEVIMGEGQSFISDWWSFGIIIYEMLFGITPFFDDGNDVELYDKILNDEIKFPKNNNISAEAKDLLQKLLIKEKNDRLGFEGGFDVIKKHYFFKGIDFNILTEKIIESPFKPSLDDEVKISNEELSFFDNINNIVNLEDINENKLEFLKNNQDKFSEFYE